MLDGKGAASEVLLGKAAGSMLGFEPAQCTSSCTDEGCKAGTWSCNCAVGVGWKELESKAGYPTSSSPWRQPRNLSHSSQSQRTHEGSLSVLRNAQGAAN